MPRTRPHRIPYFSSWEWNKGGGAQVDLWFLGVGISGEGEQEIIRTFGDFWITPKV